MRRYIWLLFVLLLICPAVALAEPEQRKQEESQQQEQTTEQYEMTEEEFQVELRTVLDALPLGDLQQEYDDSELFVESAGFKDIVVAASQGELPMNAWDILKFFAGKLFSELQQNAELLLKIIVIAIIASMLSAIGPENMSGEISKLCSMVIYLVIAVLIAQSLYSVMQIGSNAIVRMTTQMEAIFPIMITLMIAMGGTATAGIFQPAMVLLTGAVGGFIQKAILPAILVYGILTMVQHTSERVQIKGVAGLVKTGAQWMIGAVFVVFLGVTALQGMTSSVYDGVTLRTAKFAIDKIVPIVGGMFSDTVDTLIGCSLVVKNGIGVVGLLMIASTVLTPVLSIAAMSFIYKIAAAVIEPFGEKRITKCLRDMSGVFTLMYVAVLAVGVMMFIMTSLLVNAGNMNVMLR